VDAARYAEPRRGDDRREGRIAAEARESDRLQLLENGARGAVASIETEKLYREKKRLRRRDRRRRHQMRFDGRE
jgi:hypothetical protein